MGQPYGRILDDVGFSPQPASSEKRQFVRDCELAVEEFIPNLLEIPHARNTNFLVADAAGDIALVEASPGAVVTTRPNDGFGTATNHFQSESMLEYEHTEERSESSETRLENLRNWADTQAGEIETTDVQQVLTDSEDGVCSCADGHEDDPVVTLWAWAVTPGTLASGTPNETPYESVEL